MRNRESKNGQPHNVDDHADEMTRSCRHLSQSVVQHIVKHVRCAGEKVTCEVLLSTHPVDYSGLLSAVSKTYCNKHLKHEFN